MSTVADKLEQFADEFEASLLDASFAKLVLTKPRSSAERAGSDLLRWSVRRITLKNQTSLSVVQTYATRDVTENFSIDAGMLVLRDALTSQFSHAHLLTANEELQLLTSKRGLRNLSRRRLTPEVSFDPAPFGLSLSKPAQTLPSAGSGRSEIQAQGERIKSSSASASTSEAHDRQKHRFVAQTSAWLTALGVTDAQQQVVPAMSRKWKQINKFVEVFAGALSKADLPAGKPVTVADFGSGKGYLTFAVHDYLTHTLQRSADVLGVELRSEMVNFCNAAAARLNLSGLRFEEGDVSRSVPKQLDVMIALHACDTATDHAIHVGVRSGAAVILCSPCCHKQLRPQLMSPHPLQPLLQHGVHAGQQAEMLTDGLRAMLLDACGYDAQVFEFVALEHTQKNKMILAVKRAVPTENSVALAQVSELKGFYGIRDQCLETLLVRSGLLLPS